MLSPTARALLALGAIQDNPGITARALGAELGVTERAARRYVAILREADLPIESVSGPYGGYRVGRGLRLPPFRFTAAEALGLVMAVLEGHRNAVDPADPVGRALAKILRSLPDRVAGPVRAVRDVWAAPPIPESSVSDGTTSALIEACTAARRLRLGYRVGDTGDTGDTDHTGSVVMDVDPWAVVLRHSRWYLLGWSHTKSAQRVLRVDRIVAIETLPQTFTTPPDLDALRTLEEHLSRGWTHPVDVVVHAGVEETARWVPRSLGRLEPDAGGCTRLRATTDDPHWYARRLAAIPVPFRVVGSPELRRATEALGRRLERAAGTRPRRQARGDDTLGAWADSTTLT